MRAFNKLPMNFCPDEGWSNSSWSIGITFSCKTSIFKVTDFIFQINNGFWFCHFKNLGTDAVRKLTWLIQFHNLKCLLMLFALPFTILHSSGIWWRAITYRFLVHLKIPERDIKITEKLGLKFKFHQLLSLWMYFLC